jgi:WD40 repeat protein
VAKARLLASVGEDKTIKLWDVPTRTLWWTPEGNKGAIEAVEFSPDAKLLATGGNVKEDDKSFAEVILRDATTWKPKQTLTDHTRLVYTLAFSPDGKTLAIGGAKRADLKKGGGKTTGELRLVRVDDRPQDSN